MSDEEILALAHGTMEHTSIPYELRAPTPCTAGMADGFPCSHVDLDGFLAPADLTTDGTTPSGSDLWGWTDEENGREYALVGLSTGTSFVDVSDPRSPVVIGFLPTHAGLVSAWRDIKTYRDHAFIVADNGGPHGVQVFDLKRLRTAAPGTTFGADARYAGIAEAHNIIINEASAHAYLVGGDQCAGGLEMADLSDPLAIKDAGCYSGDGYTHDAQCVQYSGPDSDYQGREICFASNEDTLTLIDVTDKSSPVQISRTSYLQAGEIGYVHQGWLTENQEYFLQDDELDETFQGHTTRTYVWDVRDLDAPTVRFSDAGGSSSDHNQYVRDGLTYQANYKRGLRILRIDDPTTGALSEVGFFDTHPETSGSVNGFSGAWSVYPFFASGTIVVSDINRGLFVLTPRLPAPPFFSDGLETGDTSGWSSSTP